MSSVRPTFLLIQLVRFVVVAQVLVLGWAGVSAVAGPLGMSEPLERISGWTSEWSSMYNDKGYSAHVDSCTVTVDGGTTTIEARGRIKSEFSVDPETLWVRPVAPNEPGDTKRGKGTPVEQTRTGWAVYTGWEATTERPTVPTDRNYSSDSDTKCKVETQWGGMRQ